ncbi:shadow of prion protein [Pempheris klunzingeri]|uniref:shadow of prion protein n=1 Tax=Pempheris klunzingeri TaxID=3127111 RepID=UPI00397E9425
MSGMKQVVATCWTCLLLSAFLCEPVLSKGGRGGSRGSSRGSPSRSSTAGSYRGGGAYGGTRSRFRAAGRTSPVRVAAAAAAGAAVALTADKWYASAYRRSNADSSEEDLDYYNRTNYFDAQIAVYKLGATLDDKLLLSLCFTSLNVFTIFASCAPKAKLRRRLHSL